MTTLFFSLLAFFLTVISSLAAPSISNQQQAGLAAGGLSPMYVARWPAPVWGLPQPRQQPYRMFSAEDLVREPEQRLQKKWSRFEPSIRFN